MCQLRAKAAKRETTLFFIGLLNYSNENVLKDMRYSGGFSGIAYL